MPKEILVVDDDTAICEALERSLRIEGFSVNIAYDGLMAVRSIEETSPDLVILDLNMPEMNGIEVTKYLRERNQEVPICILSARDEVSDRVLGLEAGADDYLVKPFALEELLARVNALLRRKNREGRQVLQVGDLILDPAGRQAAYKDLKLALTKVEFDLLAVLMENENTVLTRGQLLDLVWGYDFEANTNVVDVFIGYLRKKTEEMGDDRLIHTVHGVGFVLRV
ncbi:MAG: response regulator transcription factor [Chloroflexota bacterium]|nr:response regulator transcription factor [Chloroflexota bacterium]